MRLFVVLCLLASCRSPAEPVTTDQPADSVDPVAPASGAEEPVAEEPALPARGPQTEWAVAGIALPAAVRPSDGPAWSQAREALELRLPYLPPGSPMEVVNRWAQRTFASWVEVRMRLTQQTIASFAAEPEPENGPANTEGRAVAGLLMDAFVAQFLAAPLPFEIESDPELRGIYEGALLEQSEPLVRQALEYYEGCERADAALEWRLFCRDRRARLAGLLDGQGRIRADELPSLRREARLAVLGPPPAGPAACWQGGAGSPAAVAGSSNRPPTVGVLGTLSAMTGTPPSEMPATIPGDVVLAVPPLGAFDQAPLETAQRATLIRAVERRLRTMVDGRVTRARAAERTTARWRGEMACRAKVDELEAVRRAHPSDQVGELLLSCDATDLCEVQVAVHPPHERGGEIVATAVGEVGDDPLTTSAWTAAVRGMEWLGSGLDRPRAAAGPQVVAFGPDEWNTDLSGLEEALRECAVPETLEVGVLYRIDRRGRARITTTLDDAPSCVSSAIRAQTFDAGAERAVTFAMRLEAEPAPRDQAYGAPLTDGVRARVSGLAPGAALNRALVQCQLRHGSAESAVGARGTVTFGADGTAESAELDALGGSPAYVACVRQALLGVVDECGTHDLPVLVCTYAEPAAGD
jgi:hypothetical protein